MTVHAHDEPYKIPHPSIYKIENVAELKRLQESLARQGLHDPWLRNEAWRYDQKHFGTHALRCRSFFLRGFIWGFAAFVITIGAEYAIQKYNGNEHSNGKRH